MNGRHPHQVPPFVFTIFQQLTNNHMPQPEIVLDRRSGSIDLEPEFRRRGATVHVDTLYGGDVAFMGNGPGGEHLILFERKRIGDMISSMREGRLSGEQLEKIQSAFRAWVIVEGIWREGDDGLLEVLAGRGQWVPYHSYTKMARGVMARELTHYLQTLREFAAIQIMETSTAKETVTFVLDQWHWWNKCGYNEHTAHHGLYIKDIRLGPGDKADLLNTALVRRSNKPRPLIKYLCQTDGIGVPTAKLIAQHYASLDELISEGLDSAIARFKKLKVGVGETTLVKLFSDIAEKPAQTAPRARKGRKQ